MPWSVIPVTMRPMGGECRFVGQVLDCDALHLAIVPGPPNPVTAELWSTDVADIVEVAPSLAAETLLAFPGVRSVRDEPPQSWDWRAELVDGVSDVRFEMNLLESEEGAALWCGFALKGAVEVDVLLRLVKHLAAGVGSAWLHDRDCRMLTAEGMAERWARVHGPGGHGDVDGPRE